MHPSQRDFARSRWLANAQEKIEAIRQRGEEIRDQKLVRDLRDRKNEWILPQTVPSQATVPLRPTPIIPGEEHKDFKGEGNKPISSVHGLPSQVKVDISGDGLEKFILGDVNYTIHKAKKIVTLEDADLNRVRFDLSTQLI